MYNRNLAGLGQSKMQAPAEENPLQKYGPHTGVYPPPDANDPERKRWYAALCPLVDMPPLDELAHVSMTYMTTTIGRNVDEPASEKREMRAILHEKARVIKLHALGLGPPPPNGMPTSGPTLYWSPELAFKREVCGSLTAAEQAKAIELGNQTQKMLHDRAKDKRKKLLTKFVAIAGIVAGGIFLGPKIAAAFKGAGAAASTGGAGAAAAGSSVLTPITVAAKPLALVGGKVVTAGAAAAAAAPAASSLLTPITVAAKPIAIKAATTAAATTAAKAASKAAVAASATSLGSQAAAAVPKVLQGVNAARTVAAIANGEVPPPPISLTGDNFTEYGVSIAKQLAEKEIGKKAQEISDAEYAAAMREMQARAQIYVPPNVAMYPSPQVSAPVQIEMVREKESNQTMQTALLIGIPVLMALFLRS